MSIAAPITRTVAVADLRRAGWASSLGSAMEYYDFALYSLASALVFGPLFFPGNDPATALILSFGTYFLGFAVRPVGGIVFGRLGDRVGRKFVLMATILLMGGGSTLIGVLPTYHGASGDWYGKGGAGVLAPILLIVLRLVQGLGAGAEMSGASVLMAEFAPPARRGYLASLPFLGVQIGTVVAAVVYFLMLGASASTPISQTWLWRIPFLSSVLILGVAIFIRLKLRESPTFVRLEANEQIENRPLRTLVTRSWKTILIGLGLRMAENGGSSIYQAFAVAYVSSAAVGIKGPIGALSLVIAAAVGAAMVPVAGRLTDRYGRRPVYRALAVYQLLTVFPIWWVLSHGDTLSTIIVISLGLGIGSWGMFGAQSALMCELFGSRQRYLGASVAREVSAVFAGGIAPMVGAAIMSASGSGNGAWIPIAGYLAVLTAITVVATFFMPETRGRDLDRTTDAIAD
ncbi:MFS transporter [Sinomonas sp. P10A9]|uniref:MFS transporter n=1 Tax=Sinomonas puerhi TaxID=3238584 RepID=A0AB39L4U3_9MICC